MAEKGKLRKISFSLHCVREEKVGRTEAKQSG